MAFFLSALSDDSVNQRGPHTCVCAAVSVCPPRSSPDYRSLSVAPPRDLRWRMTHGSNL